MADAGVVTRYLVLGPLDAVGNGDAAALGGPKQRAVLGMLISRVGQVVTGDQLVDGIWGERAPSAVASSLRTYVSNLRTAVGADIERSGGGYVLRADPASVDAFEFERLTDEATGSLSVNPGAASDKLRLGLGLWRGKPYSDLLGVEGLQSEIRRLEELRLSAVEARIDADLALGRHQALTGELAALATEYPLRERFQAQLMVSLYRDGRQSEALRTFQRTREHLRDELGIDPSPELQDLELRILNHDSDLLTVRDTVTERVAFLFTDIAGSAVLWETRGGAMRAALARHDEIVASAIDEAGGRLFKHTGDGVLAAFARVASAANAAVAAQHALLAADWGDLDLGVRMALDLGEVDVRGGDYFGPPMNRGSRILAAGHGGQILVSDPAQQALAAEPGIQVRSLGEHRLKGLGTPVRVFQLLVDGLPAEFPDLRLDGTTTGPTREFGDAIRGYEVRERLAAGRISVVYRAFQPTVGREVAVKVIRPEFANHPSFVRRFESEARTVAGLEHPHIVSLYDYWRDADGAYLVMPLMAGGSLADKNPLALPLERVLEIASQIGSALGYAHRQGVIHRDIKLSNILLDGEGNAYLGDFGIAVRGVERDAGIQSESAIHRAPEDRAGSAVDERSDVYSMGRVVAGLLTGAGSEPPDLSSLDGPLRELLESALAENPAERPESIDSFVGRLGALTGGVTVTAAPVVARNPYKGLRPFDVDDARDFFGRDEEIRRLVELVGRYRIVTVVGPSGSGKSSLVRAGLLPALYNGALPGSGRWVTVTTLPGSYPFDELASALGELATESMGDIADELAHDERGLLRISKSLMRDLEGELLIVVDQLEELYTVVANDEVRRSFLQNLINATADARSRVRVVLTLRADFFDHPLGDELLGPIVTESLLPLTVPQPGELHQAIERPAANAGVNFEDGLTDQLLADVQEQPGSLPLMQYALATLVSQSVDGQVTTADYERLGGVSGALTRRADEEYRSLDPEQQAVAEEIFMRLVSASEDADDVRRRVRQSELESLGMEPGNVAEVLRRFGEARLLTFDRDPVTRGPTVEVAHEALLRHWDRFRSWLDARREALILHRRFRAAESEWEESAGDAAYLLTGGRLSQFETWADGADVVLTPDESEFLDASIAARTTAETRRRRLRRGVLSGFGFAALIAIVLAIVAILQRTEAQESAEVAEARELTLEAEKAVDFDPELSAHLALASLATLQEADADPAQAISALRAAVVADRIEYRIPGSDFVAVHPDGALIATADTEVENGIAIWDYTSGEVVEHYPSKGATAWGADFSPDGNLLAVSHGDEDHPPFVTVWDRATRESFDIVPTAAERVPLFSNAPLFSPDGAFLMVSVEEEDFRIRIELWSVEEHRLIHKIDQAQAAAFTGAGLLAYAMRPGGLGDDTSTRVEITVVDPSTFKPVGAFATELAPPIGANEQLFISWSPDDTRLAVSDQVVVVVHDAQTGEEISRTSSLDRAARAEWLPDGQSFMVGGEDVPSVVDAMTGEVLFDLDGGSPTIEYRVVPGTTLVAAAPIKQLTSAQEILVYETGVIGEIAGWPSQVDPFQVGFTPDGSRVVVSAHSNDGSYVVANPYGTEQRFVQGSPFDWFPQINTPATFITAHRPDGIWTVQDVETGDIVYAADPGWSLGGVSWDATRAVIVATDNEELGWCERGPSRIVSIPDGSTTPDLDLACAGRSMFSPDGSLMWVFQRYAPHLAGVFDSETGQRLVDFTGTRYAGAFVGTFSPDGTKLVVASDPVFVFDVAKLISGGPIDDALLLEIDASESPIFSVAFSPDGSKILTGGNPLKIWDLETGRRLGGFGGTADNMGAHVGDFHPTEKWLLVTSPPNEVRIYTLDIDELVSIAESRLSRPMTEEECLQYFRESCEDAGV